MALIMGAINGHKEVVKVLLEAGVDVQVIDSVSQRNNRAEF